MKTWGTAMVNAGALAISSGMNFLALFLWTRLLDPGTFGSYALMSASALLINAFMFDWLRLVSGRLLYDPKAPNGINPQRGNALAALALGMALWARSALSLSTLAPTRTTRQVRQDAQALSERVSG